MVHGSLKIELLGDGWKNSDRRKRKKEYVSDGPGCEGNLV